MKYKSKYQREYHTYTDTQLSIHKVGLEKLTSKSGCPSVWVQMLGALRVVQDDRRVVRHYRAQRSHALAGRRFRAVVALGLMKLGKV